MQSKSEIEKLYCQLIDKAMIKLGSLSSSANTGYFIPGKHFEKRMKMLARYRQLWGL